LDEVDFEIAVRTRSPWQSCRSPHGTTLALGIGATFAARVIIAGALCRPMWLRSVELPCGGRPRPDSNRRPHQASYRQWETIMRNAILAMAVVGVACKRTMVRHG
jgi:hypothetical protein